jgi:hypothetical protein
MLDAVVILFTLGSCSSCVLFHRQRVRDIVPSRERKKNEKRNGSTFSKLKKLASTARFVELSSSIVNILVNNAEPW